MYGEELYIAVINGLKAYSGSLIVALDALGNDEGSIKLKFVKSRLLQ